MVRVKICGITNLPDALAALRAGADALGFVFAESPRRVEVDQALEIIAQLPPLAATVGVFKDAPLEEVLRLKKLCGLDWVQLCGREDSLYVTACGPRVIKTLAVDGQPPDGRVYPDACLLLDAPSPRGGGAGKCFDWNLARPLAQARPVILAGGLNPDNVGRAIATARPWAVDVSSGVEAAPGRKDHELIQRFIANAKQLG
ncbi:MAG: phosphoribosylanthranilate isomerase [Desulfarculus sp.]|nr:phosphoribosylanthranilate isomerase [Desulfarculus sp.]